MRLTRKSANIEILGPEDAAEKEARVRARFWPTVKKALRIIPFIGEVVAAGGEGPGVRVR